MDQSESKEMQNQRNPGSLSTLNKIAVTNILNISEFIHSAISCATKGEIEDADLLVFSWVHSRSEKLKFIGSLRNIEGLRQSGFYLIQKKCDHSLFWTADHVTQSSPLLVGRQDS